MTQKADSATRRVWNDGSGSLFTEEIAEDETMSAADPRYLGEYRGPGYLTEGWMDVPANEDEWLP